MGLKIEVAMMRMAGKMFVIVFLLAVGCGGDTVEEGGNNGANQCLEGERWNPILAKCDVEGGNSGTNGSTSGTPNNSSQSNGTPNGNTNVQTNNTNVQTNNNTTPANNTMMVCGMGALLGKTCAPSGEPLAAADVTISGIDCATGQPFEQTTRTGSDGTFDFMDVPAGQHSLTIEIGSFNSMRQVIIQADQTTDLTSAADKVCLDQSVEIAVLGGTYDHVEGLLTGLNLTFEMKGDDGAGATNATNFLSDLTAMNEYDIIFVNCGDWYIGFLPIISPLFLPQQQIDQIYANLRAYVQGGKSLYFSDLAYPFLENAFPDLIDFYGANDAAPPDAMQGYAPQTVATQVMTPNLQTVLGRNTATIEYPHDPFNGVINNNWAIPVAVGGGATAQLVGDVQLCGNGNCSMPGATQADVPLLVTYQDPSGGAIVYTSFHNERQAALNMDMELILRFLIFQL